MSQASCRRLGQVRANKSCGYQVNQVNQGRFYLLWVLLCVAVLSALSEGFRMPNLWSINYFIPSFFDGFFRRSLVGSVLWFFGELRFNYFFIAAIQYCILIALILIIFFKVRNNFF